MKRLSLILVLLASNIAYSAEVLDLESSLPILPPPEIDEAALMLANVDSQGRAVLGVITSINPDSPENMVYSLYRSSGDNSGYELIEADIQSATGSDIFFSTIATVYHEDNGDLIYPKGNYNGVKYYKYSGNQKTEFREGSIILDKSGSKYLESRVVDKYALNLFFSSENTSIEIKNSLIASGQLSDNYFSYAQNYVVDENYLFHIVRHDFNNDSELERIVAAHQSFAVSDDGQLLAYAKQSSSGMDYVVRNIETGAETVIDSLTETDGPLFEFSPSGRYLAYIPSLEPGSKTVVLDLESNDRSEVLVNAADNIPILARFSPDESFLYLPEMNEGATTVTNAASIRRYSISSATQQSISVKVKPELTQIDPYTNPVSSIDIATDGELFAADVSCTVAGPMDITSADYGNWGGSERLTLPLQWTSKDAKGVVSLKGDVDSVSGEQQLLVLDTLAEVTTADVTVNCAATVSDKNGNQLNVNLIPATIRLDDGIHGGSGVITGQVTLPAGVNSEDVTVEVTINGRTIRLNVDENGRFEFDELRDGDFTINVKSEHYTQSCINTQTTGSQIDLGNIELIAGDVNNDGEINIADFTYLAGRYGSAKGDDRYTTQADLNSDEKVNIQDLAILGSHFGSRQCNP